MPEAEIIQGDSLSVLQGLEAAGLEPALPEYADMARANLAAEPEPLSELDTVDSEE